MSSRQETEADDPVSADYILHPAAFANDVFRALQTLAAKLGDKEGMLRIVEPRFLDQTLPRSQ